MENEEKPDLGAENNESTGENIEIAGTSRERKYEIGKGKPPVATRFSAGQQPDHDKSVKTKKIKAKGRELLREMLSMKYEFREDSPVRDMLVKAFGKKVLKCTVLELVTLQQFQKAILKGDTQAALFITNQSYGLPKQIMEHSGPDGKPIETSTTVKRVIIENPHNKVTIQNPHLVSPQAQQ